MDDLLSDVGMPQEEFCSKWGISEKELETDEAGTNYTELTAEIEGQECTVQEVEDNRCIGYSEKQNLFSG